MKVVLILLPLLALTACGQTRMALSPAQCKAPTASEAQLTKSVWQTKPNKQR